MPFTFGQTQTIELEPGPIWTVQARFSNAWSPPVEVQPGVERVVVPLYPRAEVRLRLRSTDGTELPPEVDLDLGKVERRGVAPGTTPTLKTSCPARSPGVYRCEAPAGRWHLRIQPGLGIPVYRWSIDVRPGELNDLGLHDLRLGSSVAGWVVTEDGSALPPSGALAVHLDLETDVSQRSPGVAARGAAQRASGEVLSSGFFQIVGLSQGRYSVSLTGATFGLETPLSLDVAGRTEVQIPTPLVLRPTLTSVTFNVVPPTDPEGRPWTLKVKSERRDEGKQATSLDGAVSFSGMLEGLYRVALQDSRGNRWAAERVEVGSSGEPIELALDIVRVEGRLRLAGEAIAARVEFSSDEIHTVSVRMSTDSEGRFSGALPRPGNWHISIESPDHGFSTTSDVIAIEPDSQRIARVEIDIPAQWLSGRVISASGQGVPSSVLIKDETTKRHAAFVRADESGSFRVALPAPRRYALFATRESERSAWTHVEIEDGIEPSAVELALIPLPLAHGRVVSGGRPVSDASVVVVAERSEYGESSLDGELTVAMPPDATAVLVSAPGLPLKIMAPQQWSAETSLVEIPQAGGALRLDLAELIASGKAPEEGAGQLIVQHSSAIVGHQDLFAVAALREDEGGLTFSNLEPGVYTVCVGTECHTGEVGALQDVTLTFSGSQDD